MKKLLLFITLITTQFITQAQDKGAAPNVNDTKYTRIIDGVVSTEKYTEPKYDVKLLDEKEEVKLKLHYHKHVMLINTQNTPIEDYIFVQNRAKYMNNNTLPQYVKVPIALNGKLLSQSDRKKMLPDVDIKKIKRIVYVNRASAQHKYANVPMGVMEVFY